MRYTKRKLRRNCKCKRSFSKSKKYMKGGYTNEQNALLVNYGFSTMQLQDLENMGITFENITNKIQEINSQFEDGFQGNSDEFVDAIISGLQQDLNQNNTAMDIDTNTDDSMHLSELDISPRSSGYTSEEDFTQNGGKQRTRRTNKKRCTNKGKRRRTNRRKRV